MKEFESFHTYIDGANGMTFDQMSTRLNQLSQEGWEIVHIHTEVIQGDIHYYYLLQRDKKPNLQQLNEGIYSSKPMKG